jgi:excinuclease ABC subunit C
MSFLPSLREHVRQFAEDRPGIYRMLGEDGAAIYVGKSVRVRSRLLSYFVAPEGEKPDLILGETRAIEWEYVPNEFAALLGELRLIQRHRPRWNVQHKRKPLFCFVKLSRDPAPRLGVVTRVSGEDAVYFGPFPGEQSVADAVLELCRVLGIRDCPATTPVYFADQLEIFNRPAGAAVPRCLRGEVGSCLAPCVGRPSAAAYGERVRAARRFLEGRGEGPLELLRQRIAEAAARLDFEYAAVLRDRAERLGEFRDQLAAWRGEVDGLTFLYRVPGFHGADRLYLIRRGRVRAELDYPKGARARAAVAERVEETLYSREPVARVLEGHDAAEMLFVASWFRSRRRELRRTKTPKEWLDGKAAKLRGGSVVPRKGDLVPERALPDAFDHAVVAREQVGGADALVAEPAQRLPRLRER